jgi:hypothetical protein
MGEAFHKSHWYCVGQVTDAAKILIQSVGGDCLAVPSGPGVPVLILVGLPTNMPDWGLIFYDEGYSLGIEIGNNAHITLYSRDISPSLHQQSADDLIIATPEEWEAFWKPNVPSK